MPFVPNLDGGGNDPSGRTPPAGSGGSGGSGGGSSSPGANPANVSASGGLFGITGQLLWFGNSISFPFPIVYVLDPSNFNCEEDCEYDFKIEEVALYRQPTVHRVILRFRDIGRATLNFFISGNVLGESVVSKIVTVVIGGKRDNKIYTATADISFTCEAPQLKIFRNANAGAFSLTKVMLDMSYGDGDII